MGAVLQLPHDLADEMVAHCLRGLPDEACGLLIGSLEEARVERLNLSENLAHSAKVYTLDPKVHLRADREAEDDGLAVIGVFHSHTHTEAFADFAVGGRGEHRAMVLCRVVRGMEPLCWEVVSLGIPYADAATARLLVAPVRQHFGANPPCTC